MTSIENTDRLVWVCDVCQRPIADGKGAVFVRTSDRLAYREGQDAISRERVAFYAANPGRVYVENMTAWMEAADPAPWRSLHHKCDRTPGDCAYWFDVSRIRTLAAVLSWTRHLMGKAWLEETAWDDLIGDVLDTSRTARAEATS